MSSGSRAWIVAASVGAVEALKDQGFARWNHALRMIQQHAKSNLRPYSQATRLSSPSSALVSALVSGRMREEKLKKSEESLRTVMYLSCWGPN
nr:Wound-responsive family protein [Ipomoea batatas]